MLIILFSQGPVGNAAVEQGDETGEEMLGLHFSRSHASLQFSLHLFSHFLVKHGSSNLLQECDIY